MANDSSIGINDPDGNTETSFDNSTISAFRTTFNADQAKNVFGLYSSGTAPSFHKGDFLVGGTPSLNTFELWKSTLTSLQLDELENGTLVAPANVSSPGDGEFARQWWYDQQSAEDQALIDSGELEYPEHLAAATFTDTFALSDNTKINLLSNGLGEFSGGVSVKGGTAADVVDGLIKEGTLTAATTIVSGGTPIIRFSDNIGKTARLYSAIPYNNENSVFTGLNIDLTPNPNDDFTNEDTDRVTEGIRVSPAFDDAGSVYGILSGIKSSSNNLTISAASNFSAVYGFSTGATGADQVSDDFPGTYAAYQGTVSAGGNRYAVFMDGSAPSLFAGGVGVTGGTVTTVPTGVISDASGIRLIHNGAGVIAGNNGSMTTAVSLAGTTAGGNNVKDGVKASSVFVGTSATASGISSDCDISDFQCSEYRFYNAGTSQGDPNPAKTFGVSSCYYAPASTAVGRNNAYGIYIDYAKDSNKVYGVYSASDAPNYFEGTCIFRPASKSNFDSVLSASTGLFGTSNSSSNAALELRGVNNSAQRRVVTFSTSTGTGSGQSPTTAGSITIQANGGGTNFNETSDYRLKSNIQTLPTVVELVKQLNPVSFDINGTNRRGFIAHELQAVEPVAVTGEKDEEEAIGTLTGYDGTVIETGVPEPPAEELEYTEEVESDGVTTTVTRTRSWAPTGTRPVYQGVDQSKLIPLLTKALQEVIAKNEDLEARLAALEGA